MGKMFDALQKMEREKSAAEMKESGLFDPDESILDDKLVSFCPIFFSDGTIPETAHAYYQAGSHQSAQNHHDCKRHVG